MFDLKYYNHDKLSVSRSNPTYLRVYARQRPGGVAWDAMMQFP